MKDSDPYDVTQDAQGDRLPHADSASAEQPKQIGRYRIEKVLGSGGFGLVYLAHDEQLDRLVAIKVPHAALISQPEDAEAYLTEARTVANLDHPHIVQVFDVGSTEDFPGYIVSKYIEGTDLAKKIKETRLNVRDAAELVATMAEALHYAHKQGLVHRDVKPGNILIDGDGKPFVLDFGLALREENIGKGPKFAGTPSYMSPEQARGEGHRVDGRSDIFSLGVVFYELLAGRQPFRGETQAELFEQVTSYEAKPLRQYDEKIPKELERICHKAMAKRASERYSSAHDMAEDLRLLLAEQMVIPSGTWQGGVGAPTPETRTSIPASASVGSVATSSTSVNLGSSDSQPIKIVPKGLRSFDAHDADFFIELLPGPRDRVGLPDSIRFWKTRIEETEPDNTFSVGLIYGPSGCGKSSLVKAGLLPRLSENVIQVYIEATPGETETKLLHGLRKRCPSLEDRLNLIETMAALRRGQGTAVGKKVLIVLDQFEQWLHTKRGEQDTDLVQALRQCDGGRVQCIVMVRDDFWLAVSRFLRDLEVKLLEGHNIALADLFDVDHARKVLAAFGRAFGRLPENISETTKDQKEFLKQSVTGLSEEGKVICVRLALFAEMMKGKTWTPATLKEVGGTTGVGVTFLEEAFSSSAASPEHRYHQKAARGVLRSLLPDSGTDIKGHMRSRAELLDASGYGKRLQDYDDLIRILDGEIRLITPTDPEGSDANDEFVTQAEAGQTYFQLTHDYMVPSLRDWLTRKQKETRRGRAELKLFDTSATWNAKPENRLLPSWWENLNIRLMTDKKKWTGPERTMMAKAGRVHGSRSALVVTALVAVLLSGITIRNAAHERQRAAESARLVEGLLQADASQIDAAIANLTDYREYANDDLKTAFVDSPDDSNAKIYAGLALLPEDDSVLPFLQEQLLRVSPIHFQHVRNLLEDHKAELIADYWKITSDSGQAPTRRFQAACALAKYDPSHQKWQDEKLVAFVARHLVDVLPSELLPWRDALRPVKDRLVAPLAVIYRDTKKEERARSFATDTLTDYLNDDAEGLFDLLTDANEQQFVLVLSRLNDHKERAIQLGNAEVLKPSAVDASDRDEEALAMRQANAAVMLLRMNAAEHVWPLLKHSPDRRVRSYIIHSLSPRGVDPSKIIARYEQEPDVTIKRALLLCLGEFDESHFSGTQRTQLIESLLAVYSNDPDAGLHAAAEWLLRQWGQAEEIAAIDKSLRQSEQQLVSAKRDKRQWYINNQGQTFVMLEAREFQMGSPETEAGRTPKETLHRRKIDRRYAIATKEVTHDQWRVFWEANPELTDIFKEHDLGRFIKTSDSPMLAMTWYEAAWYCNWLSKQEGVPEDQWCYEKNEEREYGPGMKAKDNFLELSGYRLPTEAEWEFACRARASTSRYHGVAESLLTNYAWYDANANFRSHPVGSLKPNDLGLFDMLGNCWEWCYDAFGEYPSDKEGAVSDLPSTGSIEDASRRIFRGGALNFAASYGRSAWRGSTLSNARLNPTGFRPARTYNLLP